MSDPHASLISVAAWLVRGEKYTELLGICETQKTISTRKLMEMIEWMESQDKVAANRIVRADKELRGVDPAVEEPAYQPTDGD
jgi:hypothetical protein